jgi:hypothetical protein
MAYEVRVNGRLFFFYHLSNLKRVSRSRWTVERHGVEYRIEGGKAAGGTSRDWWLDGPGWDKSIDCTSLVDALKCLEGM